MKLVHVEVAKNTKGVMVLASNNLFPRLFIF
jgi:hypothetical protein